MDAGFMQKVQRSGDSVWSLPARTSITLRVGPGPRVVQVRRGRLWLTSPGTTREASLDVWLVAGESLELPAGLEVVAEAWPSAEFRLLVPPCRTPAGGPSLLARSAHRVGRWLQDGGFGGPRPGGRFAR